jgi:Glycosyltransferases involved in cell wall biogenesis
MSSSKISVIVPVYNVEKYIAKCLESLISQTLHNIEIICVNDGSTDNSLSILNSFAKQDRRIKIINQKNHGAAAARNVGIKIAKSKYIMFCDSDDYYDDKMCAKMLNIITNHNVDIAICGMNIHYLAYKNKEKSDNDYYRVKFNGRKKINTYIICQTDVAVVNKIFRTDIIKNNNLEFPAGFNSEDFYFYNAYMMLSHSVYFIQDKLYNYIRRSGSVISNLFDKTPESFDHLYITEKLYDFMKKTGALNKYRDLFWTCYISSYYFALLHSPTECHKQLNKLAKKFISAHSDDLAGVKKPTRQQINIIKNNHFFFKIHRKNIAKICATIKKIAVPYRQRKFITKSIDNTLERYDDLREQIEDIKNQVPKLR